jgi:hypothetical protein
MQHSLLGKPSHIARSSTSAEEICPFWATTYLNPVVLFDLTLDSIIDKFLNTFWLIFGRNFNLFAFMCGKDFGISFAALITLLIFLFKLGFSFLVSLKLFWLTNFVFIFPR